MIEMEKKYQYRNGEPATIVFTNARNRYYPVISVNEYGLPLRHTENGKYDPTKKDYHPYDLIEIKEPNIRYYNLYPDTGHASREEADRIAMTHRIGCIKIDLNEGRYEE